MTTSEPNAGIIFGIQSVLFHYLACSPCRQVAHRRKARIKAKEERKEKAQLEMQQPGLYRHPSPFQTNENWAEEIRMGPSPPSKKGSRRKGRNDSQRALNAPGPGTSVDGSIDAVSTQPGSSPTIDGSQMSDDGERWNWKRYQRNDEPLWGLHEHNWPGGQKIKSAIARAGSTAGRLLEQVEERLSKMSPADEAEESDVEEQGTYLVARNPPVNDLHPPVVSTRPSSKAETAWMLQPPPPAKIMEGKMRVDSLRSRANSGASNRLGTSTPVDRRVSERQTDSKHQRGDHPDLRPTSVRTSSRPKTANSNLSQHCERMGSSEEDGGSEEGRSKRRSSKRKPPPISVTPIGRGSKETIRHIPIPSEVDETVTRPASTTISTPMSIPRSDNGLPLKELSSKRNTVLNSRSASPEKSPLLKSSGKEDVEGLVKSENERPSTDGNAQALEA